MQEPELFKIFLKPLNDSEIPYMVTGSAAGIIYGQPRMTHDIDLVVELGSEGIEKFTSYFPAEEFYCPPLDVIKTETAREARGHFNLIHHDTGFKADIYPAGRDELHKWAIPKRQKVSLEDIAMYLAPPEYVILRKLQYFREGGSSKHLTDIRSIFQNSAEIIDTAFLNTAAAKYGLSDLLEQCKSS